MSNLKIGNLYILYNFRFLNLVSFPSVLKRILAYFMSFKIKVRRAVLNHILKRYDNTSVLEIMQKLRNPLHNQASSWCRNQ